MCNLSKREREVLDLAMTSADDKIVAMNLRISDRQVRVHKSRVRRKEQKAKSFLKLAQQYKKVLHPEPRYKGVQ